jgi:hypothetical protein
MEPPSDSLVAVVLRSTYPIKDPSVRFARNLLVSVFATAQYLTASHHGSEYSTYPIVLLQSLSLDLRQSLDSLTQCLEEWSIGRDD